MNRSIIAAIAASILASPAHAGCKPGNLRGIWQDLAFAYAGVSAVGHCTFIIAGDGSVSTASVCRNYTPTEDIPPIHFVSGQFVVNESCGVTATLSGDNGIVATLEGQMQRNKQAFTAISRNNTGTVTLHNFIKQ
jgi:hypothetical protein